MTMSPVNMNENLDLSKLAQSADSDISYVKDTSEADFEAVASLSMQHPVVLELTLPSAPETRAVDQTLIELTNQAEGRWLLARIDVSTSPNIARALGVQAVPTVLALIAGQVAPLFQGTRDKDSIKAVLDQVVKASIANGVTGRARPVPGGVMAGGGAATTADTTPTIDPRFGPADEALTRGDMPGALAEFEKLLAANPRDAEAASGKAQVSLMLRAMKLDPTAVLVKAGAHLDDVDAQLDAADVEIAEGQVEAGFARLVDAVRRTKDKDREKVRVRLVELFSTMPPGDPTVAKARRDLTSALY